MSRLERLRTIRGIELNGSLRALASAEARLGQLGEMRLRLADLTTGMSSSGATASRKSAAASRARLAAADVQVAAALGSAQAVRDQAAAAAACQRVRADVVDAALAARR